MKGFSAHDDRFWRSGRRLSLIALPFLLLILAGCGVNGTPSDVSSTESVIVDLDITTPTNTATRVLDPTAEATPSAKPSATATKEPQRPTDTPTRKSESTATPMPTATSTATTAPQATPTEESTPVPRVEPRLLIPALNVNAVVVPVGLDASGAMAAPEGWFEVGWFRYGPRPGFAGSAALAGHLDTNTGAPATFWELGQLTPGQEIIYQAEDGSLLTFIVDEVATYPWDQVPLDRVFARSGDPRIALITCGGAWSREHRNYSHRTIVYASQR